jgi:hypothetical protein
MSFFDNLLGNTAADASKRAASDTYAKQQIAVNDLKNYGDQYASKYEDMSHGYDPYVQTGLQGNSALMRLLQDPNSVRSLPGYDFAQGEGVQALDRSAAARGRLNSGRQEKDLLRFGTGLADSTYGSQLARLLGVGQYGMAAQGAQNSTVGQGLAGQLGTRQSAYGGQFGSAGTIGQGDIAAANAQAAGSQNILNTGLKLGGMALGAFTGMPGGMPSFGGGASSYGGGSPGYNSSPQMGGAGAGFDPYGRAFNWGG